MRRPLALPGCRLALLPLVLLVGAILPSAAPASSETIWSTGFEQGFDELLAVGRLEQFAEGRLAASAAAARDGERGLRVDVRAGELFGPDLRNRSEIALANPDTPTRPQYNDIVDTTRFIGLSARFPSPTAGGGPGEQGFWVNTTTDWTTSRGLRYHLIYQQAAPSEAPPVALDMADGRPNLVLADDDKRLTYAWTGRPITHDRWYRFVLECRYAITSAAGYVRLWMDDGSGAGLQLVVPKTPWKTIRTKDNGVRTAGYDKFGGYRYKHTPGHTVHYMDDIVVASSFAAAAGTPAPSGPADPPADPPAEPEPVVEPVPGDAPEPPAPDAITGSPPAQEPVPDPPASPKPSPAITALSIVDAATGEALGPLEDGAVLRPSGFGGRGLAVAAGVSATQSVRFELNDGAHVSVAENVPFRLALTNQDGSPTLARPGLNRLVVTPHETAGAGGLAGAQRVVTFTMVLPPVATPVPVPATGAPPIALTAAPLTSSLPLAGPTHAAGAPPPPPIVAAGPPASPRRAAPGRAKKAARRRGRNTAQTRNARKRSATFRSGPARLKRDTRSSGRRRVTSCRSAAAVRRAERTAAKAAARRCASRRVKRSATRRAAAGRRA